MVTLEDVRARREEILALAVKNKLSDVRVVGSVARGEQHLGSDLDLLVACEPGCSLLDLVGFELDLSDLLGVKVEAATERGQKPRVEATLLRNALPL